MQKIKITSFRMDHGENKGLTCSVPCSLYSVLLEHKLIKDPFFGENERELTALSETSVDFTSELEVPSSFIASHNQILRLHGVDTLATVYLNGHAVATTDNMHRTYDIDVKGRLHIGRNLLKISIASPLLEMRARQEAQPLTGDGNSSKGIAQLRKAYYMSGWDWAPKLPDMGIFRDVELIAYDHRIIDRIDVRQTHLEDEVNIDITLHTLGNDDMSRAVATLVSPGAKVYYCGLVDGKGTINVKNPNLWWPNGLGAQNLYKLSVNLYSGTELEDSRDIRIGLRTLELSREKDEYGEEFAFKVNGEKFFSMGANYVPEDSILPRLDRTRTKRLLTDCKTAGFNTVRVWGGAFYPYDYFYDLCDELGLVVWQDFMVACCNIRLNDGFLENFTAEFYDNFRRIAHHPSLGLVCGNNEMELAVMEWAGYDGEQVRRDYLKLYEDILPALSREVLPDTPYWPASPSSGGGFDAPNAEDRGDGHYWACWGGGMPFEDVRDRYFRFCSEFGFESLPSLKTVRAFATEEDMNLFSPVMEHHQRNKGGNLKMLTHGSLNYRQPLSFEDTVYMSQLVQADAIRYAVEHFRRHRGRCMGTTYWQLNDCWPVSSWSSIDYYGRWKALHYYARRFYSPTLVIAEESGTRVDFSFSNEQRRSFTGTLCYAIKDVNNRVIYSKEHGFFCEQMSSVDIISEDFAPIVQGREREVYLEYFVRGNDTVVSRGTLLFVKPKSFSFPKVSLSVKISGADTDFILEVSADCYARGVELDFTDADGVFDDNYFDITSDTPVRIAFKSRRPVSVELLRRTLTVKTVYSIGR